jgi:Gpi18-like mannosyltransferase
MSFISDNKKFILIALIGLILRLVVSPYYTHSSDMGLWIYWAKEINRIGFHNFFGVVNWTDYLPLYFYFLYICEFIRQTFNLTGDLIFKMPGILSDIGTAFILYLLSRAFIPKYKLIIPTIYLFNPAVFGNSAMWGQVDGLGAFLVTLCLYLFLKQRLILLGIAIALAVLFKPLYLLILPIFLVAQVKYEHHEQIKLHNFFKVIFKLATLRRLSIILSTTAIASFIITAPFAKNILLTPSLIIERYGASLGQYKYASVNAFNFWSMVGQNFKSDEQLFLNITYHNWGLIIFCLIFGTSLLVFYIKKFTNIEQYFKILTLLLALTYISIFTFATRVHERHLLTLFPFLTLLLSLKGPLNYLNYFLASLLYIANLYFGIEYLYKGNFPFENNVVQLYSGAVVLLNLLLLFEFLQMGLSKNEKNI